MAYARPFYRSSRLQHLAAGLALGLCLVLVASTCGDRDSAFSQDLALAGGVEGEIPIDLDVQVIPGDCDSTGAEAYRVPYGPDETPPDGVRDRIRVVIHTCCCCADSSYTPLGLLRGSGATPGEVASVRRRPPANPPPMVPEPTIPEAPRDAIPPIPTTPLAALTPVTPTLPGATATPPLIQSTTRVPWWLGLLAIPAGFFVIEEMPEGTICDDSGPAVGPNRASCDLPPTRSPRV